MEANMADILGDANDNTLNGTTGNDVIFGFFGNDELNGADGNDVIYGNQGNDTIDDIPGLTGGDDTLYGGQGNDSLGDFNAKGDDLIYGNFGNDTIQGGDGNDHIYGGRDNDHIDSGGGNDTVFGGQGHDEVNGGSGNDLIYGNFGNDVLSGAEGNDTVFGGQGDDNLVAQLDNDQDRLFGNLGADAFDFTALNPSGQTDATADRIADFSHTQGDQIRIDVTGTMEFTAISNSGVTSVEQAINAANSANAFSANDVVFVAGATNGYLLVDQDDNGSFGSSTDFAIVLQNVTTLTAADILAF
jgi:serralysin